jgi:hypothetical protein
MSTEKLNFKIGLSGTYWDKKPHYIISVNGKEYASGYITLPSGETEYIRFECEVDEDRSHVLSIRLDNKDQSDVVKDSTDPDNYNIVKDMLLNLESIEADDIELGNLIQMYGVFKFDEPQQYPTPGATEIERCVNFGFNGTYELEFNSPFYLWLLDRI